MNTDYERGVREGAGYLWQFIVGELRSIAESEIDKPEYALLASTLANHLQNLNILLPQPEIDAEERDAAAELRGIRRGLEMAIKQILFMATPEDTISDAIDEIRKLLPDHEPSEPERENDGR